MNNFFDNNVFLIDEKVGAFKLTNAYRVYDKEGKEIGGIQQKMSGSRVMLALLVNKAMLPFSLDIVDETGAIVATIKRGWSFILSKIIVLNGEGKEIAYIKQKFSLKPKFHIMDMEERVIGRIEGDWLAWDFKIKDNQENNIGSISKKWNGLMKEVFTTADKYIASVSPEVTDINQRIAVIATAITIDMVLKESK